MITGLHINVEYVPQPPTHFLRSHLSLVFTRQAEILRRKVKQSKQKDLAAKCAKEALTQA